MHNYNCVSCECMMHLLHDSSPIYIVIQGNSIGVFNGLLAELPTTLDSFYQYHK